MKLVMTCGDYSPICKPIIGWSEADFHRSQVLLIQLLAHRREDAPQDEGKERAKQPATSDSLLAAMRSLGTYDTGGFVVSYGAGQQHGSKFVDLVMVSRSGRMR